MKHQYCTGVRPKPGFGIMNRNQGPISVVVLERIFFSKTDLLKKYLKKAYYSTYMQ